MAALCTVDIEDKRIVCRHPVSTAILAVFERGDFDKEDAHENSMTLKRMTLKGIVYALTTKAQRDALVPGDFPKTISATFQ